jgi:hypothetical protein
MVLEDGVQEETILIIALLKLCINRITMPPPPHRRLHHQALQAQLCSDLPSILRHSGLFVASKPLRLSAMLQRVCLLIEPDRTRQDSLNDRILRTRLTRRMGSISISDLLGRQDLLQDHPEGDMEALLTLHIRDGATSEDLNHLDSRFQVSPELLLDRRSRRVSLKSDGSLHQPGLRASRGG